MDKSTEKFVKTKQKSRKYRYNHLNIREFPLVKLLLSKKLPSTLSRNHYLEQSMAKFLRDNEIDIDEIRDVITEIDHVQQKSIQIDPVYLEDEGCFNAEVVNVYCIACGIDLVFEILDDIPEIANKIEDERFDSWNTLSYQTLCAVVDKSPPKIEGYIQFKKFIRDSIDAGDSIEKIFFTCKLILQDDWDYYYRNKIIQTLINKTRRRIY